MPDLYVRCTSRQSILHIRVGGCVSLISANAVFLTRCCSREYRHTSIPRRMPHDQGTLRSAFPFGTYPQVEISALDQFQAGDGGEDSATELVETEKQHSASETTKTVETVEYPPEFEPAAVVVETFWRGFAARMQYEEIRTTRQWAAVKLQSSYRARKARRVFSKHMRYCLF